MLNILRQRSTRWLLLGGVLAALVIIAATVGRTVPFAESTDVETELARAEEFKANGDLRSAFIVLKTALQSDPENRDARQRLGELHLLVENGASAEKELRQALRLGSDPTGLLVPLARAKLLQNHYEEVLEEPLPEWSELPAGIRAELLALHGRAHFGLERFSEARDHFDRSLVAVPDNLEALIGHGYLAARAGDIDKTREWFERAAASNPQSARPLSLLGDVESQAGDLESAEDALSRAIALEDRNPDYLKRASLRLSAGDTAGARADISVLEARKWPHLGVTLVQAQLDLTDGSYDAALKKATDVLSAADKIPAALLVAGRAAARLGQREQAMDYLRRYLALVPQATDISLFMGKSLYETGQFDEAERIVSSAREANPKYVPLRELEAWLALRQGKAAKAVSVLGQLANANLDSADAAFKLGLALSATGKRERARKQFERAAALAPDSQMAKIWLFNSQMLSGQPDAALSTAKAITEQWPDSPYGLVLSADAYRKTGDRAAAEAALKQALEVEPGNPSASRKLATVFVEDQRFDDARAILQESTTRYPGQLQTTISLARVEQLMGRDEASMALLERAIEQHPRAVNVRVALAERYRMRGELERAQATLQPALGEAAGNAAMLLELGKLAMAQDKPNVAVGYFEQLTTLVPKSAGALFLLASAHALANNEVQAREHLIGALKLEPTHFRSLLAAAQLMIRDGKGPEARAFVQRLENLYPEHPEVAALSGRFALASGQYAEAVRKLAPIHEEHPSASLALELAEAHGSLGDSQRKMAILEHWVENHENDVEVLLSLGDAYADAGRKDEARKAFLAAIDAEPRNVRALNNLAWLLRKTDPAEGLEYATLARRYSDDAPLVVDTYAALMLETGQSEGVIDLLVRASKDAPDEPVIKFHLAQAFASEGHVAHARSILDQLLTETPAFAQREEAERFRRSLGK